MNDNYGKFPENLEGLLKLADGLGVDLPFSNNLGLLAQPITVDGFTLPSRIAIHPMEGCDGMADGKPGELTLRRYARFAGGGAGLIWVEAIAVVPEGRANPRQLYINRENLDSFRELVDLIRNAAADKFGSEHRPLIVAQLTHSGRYSRPNGKSEPVIAHHDPNRDAAINLSADYQTVSDDYLDELQSHFVEAAELAYAAGFDSVDVKCCHGYLLHELLSGHLRSGRYGGSFENRTRMLRETVEKIRSRFGAEKSITTRLGVFDAIAYPHGWGVSLNDYLTPDLSEPQELITQLHALGVNLINMTLANPYYNPFYNRPFDRPAIGGQAQPEHPLLGVVRLIKLAGEIQWNHPAMTVIGTGYTWLREYLPQVAAGVIERNYAKIIGAGRMAFAYPEFAADIINEGKLDKSKVCIVCSSCTQIMRDGGMAGCPVRDSEVYGPIYKQGRHKAKQNGDRK